MRSLGLIARREFIAYWTSPVAYVVLAVFMVLSGFFFFGGLADFVDRSVRQGGQGVDVNQQVIGPYFSTLSVIVLFLLPLLSMRLLAEEKRQGTLEILLTTPITEWSLVGGKYLASLALYLVLLLPSMFHVGLLFVFGSPEWAPVLTGFLGLLLTGAAYLSLGLFLSSTTQNQVVAAAVSFAAFLILWLAFSVSRFADGVLSQVLAYISFTGHFGNFARGVLDTSDFVFYITLIAAGLFGATQAVLSTRWKA